MKHLLPPPHSVSRSLAKASCAIFVASLLAFSCNNGNTVRINSGDEYDYSDGKDYSGTVFAEFENYPKGKENPNGTLKIENLLTAESVLVFDGSVEGANYVGTVTEGSSINVKLEADKFHTLIGICKSTYENDPESATQVSARTYYSNTQGYAVKLSPSNLVGAGKWTFNNKTSYWVQIKSQDESQTYAVVQPNMQQVTIPIELNKTYTYKIIYEEEIKLNGVVLAINPYSDAAQNDSFMLESGNTKRDTNLTGIQNGAAAKSDPIVQLINNSGKGLFLYNGDTRLAGFSSTSDDYVLNNGKTEYFTGFASNTNLSALAVDSTAWSKGKYTCEAKGEDGSEVSMESGKVYVVEIIGTDSSTSKEPPKFTLKQIKNLSDLQ